MATICLRSALSSLGYPGPWLDYPRKRIEESYAHDTHKQHTLIDDPEKADVILYATNHPFLPGGLGIFEDPVFRRNRKRCVYFSSIDSPPEIVGGLCASWNASLKNIAKLAEGWCYFHPKSAEPFLHANDDPFTPQHLWSFKGSITTHPVRAKIFALKDPRSFTEDTSRTSISNLMNETSEDSHRRFYNEYAATLRGAAFVLCPRGVGASSMRIFEAMRIGRAPVIISDDWLPPPFIDWASCSLRIPENEIDSLPAFLREKEPLAAELGRKAHTEWQRVLGPTGLFHFTTEACLKLLAKRQNMPPALRALRYWRLLHPYYLGEMRRYLKLKMGGKRAHT